MLFTSPYLKLSVVVKPSRHTTDASGQRIYQAGKKAEFRDGKFKTEDEEIIDFLLNHKDLNVRFHAQGVKTDKKKVEEAKKKEEELAKDTKAKSTNKKVASNK